jgi:hypothetical protein
MSTRSRCQEPGATWRDFRTLFGQRWITGKWHSRPQPRDACPFLMVMLVTTFPVAGLRFLRSRKWPDQSSDSDTVPVTGHRKQRSTQLCTAGGLLAGFTADPVIGQLRIVVSARGQRQREDHQDRADRHHGGVGVHDVQCSPPGAVHH